MAGKSLLKSTSTVGGMTLLSRVLGFIRDMVIARVFGAGAGADAFFVAFKIPNFMRRLFAEGAFSQAFVPVFTEYKSLRQPEEARDFSGAVSGTLGSILLVVTLVGVVGAAAVIAIFAPGFLDDPEKYELAVDMLRLTFPYLFFISMTAFSAGILNSYGQFAVPAFTPVLLNISLISAALGLAPLMDVPITALAWGVFVAGLAQLLFQLPYLARIGMLSRPRWAWRDEGVQRVIKLMLPAIFGSSVAQINLLFDTLIASFLVTGSVSWLYYSDRLVEFPLGVFGIALATVILPSLSRKHAEASTDEFARTLDWALRWVLLVGTPATVGLMLLAAPMLATLFQYGEFSAVDVEMAALSLVAYSFGLLGFILVKVLAPGFYARQDTRTPVRIGVIAMLSNMALNLVFVVPMVLMDLPGPHAGLAAATSLAAFINAGLLFKTLRKQGVYQAQPGWRKLLWQVGFANVVMAAALWWGRGDLAQWLLWSGLERAGQLTLWIVVGAAGYFVALLVAGVRPAQIKALMSQR
jgi:putative peptidoglycan lipid II flippase